jgi:hypothetical protein
MFRVKTKTSGRYMKVVGPGVWNDVFDPESATIFNTVEELMTRAVHRTAGLLNNAQSISGVLSTYAWDFVIEVVHPAPVPPAPAYQVTAVVE